MCGTHGLIFRKIFRTYSNGGFFGRKKKPADDSDLDEAEAEVVLEEGCTDVDAAVTVEGVETEIAVEVNMEQEQCNEPECNTTEFVSEVPVAESFAEITVEHTAGDVILEEQEPTEPVETPKEGGTLGENGVVELTGSVQAQVIFDDDAIPNETEENVGTFTGNARVKISIYISNKTLNGCIQSIDGLNYENEAELPQEIRFLIKVPSKKYTLKTNWVPIGSKNSVIPALSFNVGPYNIGPYDAENSGELAFEIHGKQKSNRRCFGGFSVNPASIIGTESTVVYVKRIKVVENPTTKKRRSFARSFKKKSFSASTTS